MPKQYAFVGIKNNFNKINKNDFGTKFSSPVEMINLRWGTCGTYKIDSLLPNEFSPYK
jgi:hypothetical protein